VAEVQEGLNGRVVRGWLSRMSPGPWSGEADTTLGETYVHLADVEGVRLATVEVESIGPHENVGPITELPRVLRAYLTVSGELVAVEHALRAAGVDEGGVAGVQSLAEQSDRLAVLVEDQRGEYDAQAAGWVQTIDQLTEAEARLTGVRALLGQWSGRELSDEGQAMYRELAGVLMARIPAQSEPEQDPDNHAEQEGAPE